MSIDVNVCIFSGRLGKDPEMRYIQSGDNVTNFPLGIGTGKDKTMWMDVEVWGSQGENVNQYCSKGDEVTVTGYMKENVWEDDSGNRRRKKSMVARFVKFGRKKGDGFDDGAETSPAPRPKPAPKSSPAPVVEEAPDGSQFPF